MACQDFHDISTLPVAGIGDEISRKRDPRQSACGSVELLPVGSNMDHSSIQVDGQSDLEISGVAVGAMDGTRQE